MHPFMGNGECLRSRLANSGTGWGRGDRTQPRACFITKFYWNTATPHSFSCCLLAPLYYKGRVECDRDHMYGLQSLKYILSGPLEKRSADSRLRQLRRGLEGAGLEGREQEGLGKHVNGARRADIKCSIFEQFLKCTVDIKQPRGPMAQPSDCQTLPLVRLLGIL